MGDPRRFFRSSTVPSYREGKRNRMWHGCCQEDGRNRPVDEVDDGALFFRACRSRGESGLHCVVYSGKHWNGKTVHNMFTG